MNLSLIIDFANPGELAEVAAVLNTYAANQEVLTDEFAETLAVENTGDPVDALPKVDEPKKARGRPKKPKAEAVSAGPAVLDQLKASVAETVPDNVVPLKKPDPVEDAVFGVPEPAAPAAPAEITTGQQLQEYIL